MRRGILVAMLLGLGSVALAGDEETVRISVLAGEVGRGRAMCESLVKESDAFPGDVKARLLRLLRDESHAADLAVRIDKEYVRLFTADELTSLRNFLGTAVGKKWVAARPELDGKVEGIAADWMTDLTLEALGGK